MLTSCVTFPKVIIKFSTKEEAEQARQVLDKFEIVKGFYLRVRFNCQWHGTNTENSKSRKKAERERKFNAFGGGGEERAAIPPLAEREREREKLTVPWPRCTPAPQRRIRRINPQLPRSMSM